MRTRNLQMFATEIFKVYQNISPPIFSEIFYGRDINYNLRIISEFVEPNIRSFFHGSESISYLGPKIWDIVPIDLQELTSADAFEKGIKKWKSKKCPGRLCRFIVFKV